MNLNEALQRTTGLFRGKELDSVDLTPLNEEWLLTLPKPSKDEMIVHLPKHRAAACMRALSWVDMIECENASYRSNQQGGYYSGIHENIEVLAKALVWVAEEGSEPNFECHLQYEVANELMLQFTPSMRLSDDESNALYSAAKAYFSGRGDEIQKLNPLIIEADYMAKGVVSLSRSEFREMPYKYIEQLQIIFAAKEDATGSPPQDETISAKQMMQEMSKHGAEKFSRGR